MFVFYWRTLGPDPRGAYTAPTWLSAVSLKKADPPARSAGLARGSAQNNSRVIMA